MRPRPKSRAVSALNFLLAISVLTPAINSEPLGPYNKELLDLSILSYDAKSLQVITKILAKKLDKTLQLAQKLGSLRTIRRSKSLVTTIQTPQQMRRASSIAGSLGRVSPDTKNELVVLKSLTVMVYLCQYGLDLFVKWMKKSYLKVVVPLGRLSYDPRYCNAIYLKVGLIVRYCEDMTALLAIRDSLDQLRSEMKPGIVGLEKQIAPSGVLEVRSGRYAKTN